MPGIGPFLFLIVPTLILGLWAQYRVTHAYNRWKGVRSRGGIRGVEAARAVMRASGITDVQIVEIPGHLTDHYDPINKRLALSSENYHGDSLAALGVAAHEAGHAIQDKVGYSMLRLRMSLVPVTGIASQILPFVILAGFFLGALGGVFIKVGIVCYLVLTVFQLVTLPVEFDASRRAKQQLVGLGILGQEEMGGVNKTLDAAAWTYVAAFVASLANLVYLLLISRDR